MKRLLLIGLIGAFAFWAYKVPLEGKLPRLGAVRSGAVMNISSNAFTNAGNIPEKYTCNGQDVSPELQISGIPSGAKSLALIMDDPDAPNGTYTHWIVFNIKPDVKIIPEIGPIPGLQAKNSAGLRQYKGPCPPSGVHRYYFKIYALDTMLVPEEVLNKTYLQQAMTGHILDSAEIMGKYAKPE
jgi:Raf kinase inhibitor-like YbhB/YbcL family protein